MNTFAKILLVLSFALLAACGGNNSKPSDNTATVSGHVVNGPLANATVSIYAADGTLLGQAETDGNGYYELAGLPPSDIYWVEASGGTLDGEPYFGTLSGQCAELPCDITPLTTLIDELAAQDQVSYGEATVQIFEWLNLNTDPFIAANQGNPVVGVNLAAVQSTLRDHPDGIRGWFSEVLTAFTSNLPPGEAWTGTRYTVTFQDHDGSELKTETVAHGGSATAPTAPTRTGYSFTGWSAAFSNVTSNLTVTAQYSVNVISYTVTFRDHDNTVLKTETVAHGSSATAPANPTRSGYSFTGWSPDYSNITGNLTVTAQYSINSYTVTFRDHDNTVLKTETVAHGSSATAPANPTRTGYTFTDWDADYSTITAETTVTAQYSINSYTVTPWADFGGSISPSTTQSVSYNTTTSFTITPDPGYAIYTVVGCDGSLDSGTNTYTTGPATYNCNVDVTFAEVVVLNATSGDGEVALSWNDIGADSYNLFYSTVADFTPEDSGVSEIPGITSPHTVAGLENLTPYYFILKAPKGAVTSTSDKISETPGLTLTLPDTGQTTCYNTDGTEISCAGTGQNGNFSVNPLSYTDNGDVTVTDTVTGLIWQQTDDGTTYTWQGALDYCNGLTLAGRSAWRLPTRRELMHIVDYGRSNSAADPVFNARSSLYWSASSSVGSSTNAWVVDFSEGDVHGSTKTNTHYVRCVRPSTIPTVTSSTGKVWMDRNLGASRVATSFDDAEAFGDLYQWGRGTDGHEKRDSLTTTTLSVSDTPGHGDFIVASNSPYDWRNPQNHNLWQGGADDNNPCPSGFRLPTIEEWQAELTALAITNSATAFASPLKLVSAGNRNVLDGAIGSAGSDGYYRSSSVSSIDRASSVYLSSGGVITGSGSRAAGFSVRCLED